MTTLSPIALEVLAYLRQLGTPASVNRLVHALQRPELRIADALKELRRVACIEKCPGGHVPRYAVTPEPTSDSGLTP